MKKRQCSICLAVAVLSVLSACSGSDDNDAPAAPNLNALRVAACQRQSADTRTIYEADTVQDNTYDEVQIVKGFTIEWAQGDQLGLYSSALRGGTSSNAPANLLLTAPASPEADANILLTEGTKRFSSFTPAEELFWNGSDGSNLFYAYYNYTSTQSTSAAAVTHTLPAVQAASYNDFGRLADYDFAYATTELTGKPDDKVVPLYFVHPYTVLLFRLTNMDGIMQANKLTLTTSSGNLAGTNTFNLTNSTVDTRIITDTDASKILGCTVSGGSSTITLTIDNSVAAPPIDPGTNTPAGLETKAKYLAMVINPAGAKSGSTLSYRVDFAKTNGTAGNRTGSIALGSNLLPGKVYRIRLNVH